MGSPFSTRDASSGLRAQRRINVHRWKGGRAGSSSPRASALYAQGGTSCPTPLTDGFRILAGHIPATGFGRAVHPSRAAAENRLACLIGRSGSTTFQKTAASLDKGESTRSTGIQVSEARCRKNPNSINHFDRTDPDCGELRMLRVRTNTLCLAWRRWFRGDSSLTRARPVRFGQRGFLPRIDHPTGTDSTHVTSCAACDVCDDAARFEGRTDDSSGNSENPDEARQTARRVTIVRDLPTPERLRAERWRRLTSD